MSLSHAENERMTRVGPGAPAGELLRRYWMPIAPAKELSEERPARFVRLLGENLVLFRDKRGRIGLLGDQCPHRCASLLYGRVEERGIACPYHGWLFDTYGNILETPPERNQAIIRSVKHTAYPVQKYAGLYWAYLGPGPAPVLPRYDTLSRRDGRRRIVIHPRLDCNWLQAMENSVDPAHLQILHQEFIGRSGQRPLSTTRGFTDDVASTDFHLTPYGIMKRRAYADGRGTEEHPLIFPHILRQGLSTQFRVPMDDTHTYHVHVLFEPTQDGSLVDDEEPSVEYLAPYKDPPEALHPEGRFDMRSVIGQDHMAWETQGPIADRTNEHLSYSDRGIAMLRKLLKENLDRVEQGLDPLGVIRDPAQAEVDTGLSASIVSEVAWMRQRVVADAAGLA